MVQYEWLSRKLYRKCDAHGNGNVDDLGDYNSYMHFMQSR